MAILKQSTARLRAFLMVQTSDHLTGITGSTGSLAVSLSKSGSTFAAAAGALTELGSGWYSVSLTTVDTNTLGDLAFHCTATSADPTDFCDQVTTQILGDTLTANATQLAGQTVTAAAGVTFPTSVASPSNITAGTITSVSSNVVGSVGSVTGAVGSVTGNVGGNVVGSVASVTASVTVGTNNDKTGYDLSATGQSSLADAILDRDMSVGADSGSTTVRTPRQALRFLRNKFAISAGTLTVYKEDDATASWTGTVTASSAASPITGNDPAGP